MRAVEHPQLAQLPGLDVADEARADGLPHLVLDTALDNFFGQRFYFRFGMLPAALRFAMRLE